MDKIFQGADWFICVKGCWSQARWRPGNNHWIYLSVEKILCVCVCVCVCTRCLFSRVQLFVTPWSVAHQAPLSMWLSRWEYLRGLPCAPPGDLPDPGILWLLLCRQILCCWASRKPWWASDTQNNICCELWGWKPGWYNFKR